MKRILVISKTPTHPTNAGNRQIILAYTELLKSMGHEVHFLYIPILPIGKAYKKESVESVLKTKSYWGEFYHEYRQNFFENLWTSSLIHHFRKLTHSYWRVDDEFPNGLINYTIQLNHKYRFDAVIVNYIFLSKVLCNLDINKKAIFTHDSFTFKDIHVGIKDIPKALLPNEEAKGLQRGDYLFAMQDEEAVFFKMLSPNSKVLTNYSIYPFIEQPYCSNHNIVFLSGSNIFNINGLKWFIDSIFPLILHEFQDCQLLIGGSICKVIQNEYQYMKGIKLLGFIDDVSEFYKLGDIAINPVP